MRCFSTHRLWVSLGKSLSHITALILASCFFVLVSSNTFAFSTLTPLKFKKLSINQGLSQSYVYDIVQDKQGFIWLATQDGLNRYDGKNFVYYRHNNSDAHSIANNFIRTLFIDKTGVLWVGTQAGLSRYNQKLDNFDNYFSEENTHSLRDNEIWDIYQDHKNKIWISTREGLHTFNSELNNFERVSLTEYQNELKEVRTIYQDKNNNYWFGTYENGIYLAVDDLSEVFSFKQGQYKNLTIDANTLYDIRFIDQHYWLATGSGVYVISENFELIEHYSQQNNNFSIPSNEVRSITEINKSTIWLGTANGLAQINIFTGEISNHQKTAHASSLSENWILKIYQDQANTVWIGTYGQGLNIINPELAKVKHGLFASDYSGPVDAINQTADNSLWLSNYENMLRISSNAEVEHISLNLGTGISHILPFNNNVILGTGENKLYQYFHQTRQLVEFPDWQSSSLHEEKNNLIIVDNFIWYINTEGVLTSFNITSHQYTNYPFRENNQFTSFAVDKNYKEFWLTTGNGELIQFEIENYKYKEFSLKATNFNISQTSSIAISKNWVWLGSDDQGLALVSKKNHQISTFNENNKALNNFVASILIDNYENAWLSTNYGIYIVNPNTSEVKHIYKDYLTNDNEFIRHSAVKASNNVLYFGGLYGYHKINPDEILNVKQFINKPILTDLLIANRKISINSNVDANEENTALTSQINQVESLKLKFNQSPFSIEFVSPNAKLPNQIRYRYKLEGLDESWIDSGVNNNRATYTNLDSGDYLFEVQAYDLYNPIITKSKKLNITILPPWWLTSTALAVYTLIGLLIMAYFLQQMRHKRLYNLQIKLSEERLKLSLWGSGDEMWDWNIEKRKIYRSNIWGILEFPQDGLRNEIPTNEKGEPDSNIHTQDLERVKAALESHTSDKSDHFELAYRVKDKNENWIWVLDRGKIVDRDNKNRASRMTGTLKDISQIKQAEERLKLFAKCIENISDAVVIYDRQFNTVDINKAYQRITLKSRKEMIGTPLTFNQYPTSFTQGVKKHLIEKGSWHGEIESIRGAGEPYLTDLNIDIIRDENGSISHFVGVFSDITKRKETEAELRKLANSDTLTGLPNRSYFQANQTRLVKNKVPHALLVFDLDNFKKINDSMGHQVGDILLCKVAERILTIGRKQDTVYRLGGDEFSIIIEDTNDIHTITTIAKEILRTIAVPLKLKSQEVVLYSSIGIVLYPEDGATPHELLKNADTAMYHAKSLGGNRYQFFSESMNKKAVKRLQIENLIRHGLKEDLFSVFYQPKIEIATGKIAGMEALVRFETPTKGIISPLKFIPVSEETGQIIDIGEVVLRKACYATKKWVDAGLFDGRIAVNLSAVQFTQPNLVKVIANILKESRLPAKYLELEITEGTVMDSPQKAIETMLQIRAMGIHLSLDDFGTGYSSLAYLKKFPLNTLKIDKAFVDDIEHSEQGRNMVATIVTIAHNLELNVVAEGVETERQLNFLSGLRCEQLQGYLYSKPLNDTDFHKYLLSHQITDKSTTFS